MKFLKTRKILISVYVLVMALFFIYYGSFPFGLNLHVYLFEHIGRIGLIAVNILIFLFFILFINFDGDVSWKGTGLYAAFFISLFTEMFGIPLAVYFMSSSSSYPILKNYYPFNHVDLRLIKELDPVNVVFCAIGMVFLLCSMLLIYFGWRRIYSSTTFTEEGLYKKIRHPQYAGLLLLTFSWALVWPTLLTWIMWPLLGIVYYNQARKEEKALLAIHGEEYRAYIKRTKMFIPSII